MSWRRDRLPTPVFLGILGGSVGKESAYNLGDQGMIPGLGRSHGGGHGSPLYYSCLENPCGQRNMAGYHPWGHKKLDMTEQLSTHRIKQKESYCTIKNQITNLNIFASSILLSFKKMFKHKYMLILNIQIIKY